MAEKPKRWHDVVATFPRLTAEQIAAVKAMVHYHLALVSLDIPAADDAHFMIQQDLDAMKENA